MATLITKNSSTASAVPAVGDLVKGELAVNVTDKKVYTKDNSAAVVKLVGSLGNQEANAVAITGGTINGTSIGATTTSTGAFTTVSASSGFTGNLTGNVTGNVSGTAANVTGVVAIANGGTGLSALGTGVQSALGQNVTGSGSFVLSTSPSLTTPNLGTPSAAVLTNATGLPLTTGVTGTLGIANGGTGITAFGTGVATALGQNVTGSGGIVLATSPSLITPNLGTPSAATLTNATGLPISTGVSGLGTGVATALAVATGSAGAFIVNGGALGTPSSGTLTNVTGLPISTGVSGLGTGVATALAVNTGSAGAFVVNGGALGTPSSGTVTNLTGTASININGTVGATTPTTGAFTTLSASGNITVSGGTANGVAYLNGSKALTTGSALVFDGSNFGLSVTPSAWGGTFRAIQGGGSGYAGALTFQNNDYVTNLATNWYFDGTSSRYFGTGGASRFRVGVGGSTLGSGFAFELAGSGNAGDAFTWTRAMTIDSSSNVGIGTSSPTRTLSVYSASSIPVQIESSGTDARISIITSSGSSGQGFIQASSGALLLGSSNTERLRVSSAGDVGIGTSSPAYKLDVSSASTPIAKFTGASNAYVDFTDGTVTSRLQNSGALLFGTTSNHSLLLRTNSTTQATLDSSGNLGLGVTPSAWGSSYKAIQLGGTVPYITSANQYLGVGTNFYRDGSGNHIYTATLPAANYTQEIGSHRWYTAASGTAGNAISFTQALTLTAAGELLVGTTSSDGSRLRVYGSYQTLGDGSYEGLIGKASSLVSGGGSGDFALRSAANMVFATNGNTERARVTSGGYFKASNNGTYIGSTGTYHEFYQTADDWGLLVSSKNASQTAATLEVRADRNTTNGSFNAIRYYNVGAAAAKFVVADSGNVTNTNGSYGTISDAKMKTDIVDAGSQWADIKAVRFRKFKMKDDPEQIVQLGVVAQELEQTSPGLVEEHKDIDKDGNDLGTTTKSVKTSVLLMKAAVALQEAMARIEQLEAKVAALETK